MLSNRTANFKVKDEQKMVEHNETILKQLTTPLPKSDFNFNFNFFDEKEKENSNFSFKNDLLTKEAYNFLKRKDEYLSAMELDDTLPNYKEENEFKEFENNNIDNKDNKDNKDNNDNNHKDKIN